MRHLITAEKTAFYLPRASKIAFFKAYHAKFQRNLRIYGKLENVVKILQTSYVTIKYLLIP